MKDKTVNPYTDPEAFAALESLLKCNHDSTRRALVSFKQPKLMPEDHSLMLFKCTFERRDGSEIKTREVFHSASYIEAFIDACENRYGA